MGRKDTIVLPTPSRDASVTGDAFYAASTVILPASQEGRPTGQRTAVTSLVVRNRAWDEAPKTVVDERAAAKAGGRWARPIVSGEQPAEVPAEYTISAQALARFADLLEHMEATGYSAAEAVACLARDLSETED